MSKSNKKIKPRTAQPNDVQGKI